MKDVTPTNTSPVATRKNYQKIPSFTHFVDGVYKDEDAVSIASQSSSSSSFSKTFDAEDVVSRMIKAIGTCQLAAKAF